MGLGRLVQVENSCRYSSNHRSFHQVSLKRMTWNSVMGNTWCQFVCLFVCFAFLKNEWSRPQLSLGVQRLPVCSVYSYTGIWRQLLQCRSVLLSPVSWGWTTDGKENLDTEWVFGPSQLPFMSIGVGGVLLCQCTCPNQLRCCLNKEVQIPTLSLPWGWR